LKQQLIVAPFTEPFDVILRRVFHVLALKETSLAPLLGVSQSRLSVLRRDWLSGKSVPDAEKLKVIKRLHRAALLKNFRCGNPHYVCNLRRLGHAHTSDRGVAALEKLDELALTRSLKRSTPEHELDIYLRSAALPGSVKTVCFGDGPFFSHSSTFIVLVSDSFDSSEAYLLGWHMVSMYIAKRLRYTPPALIYAYDPERQRQIRAFRSGRRAPFLNSQTEEWQDGRAGILIDRICYASNYNHEDLAAELRCSPGTIAKWYSGACKLKRDSREKLTALYLRSSTRLFGTNALYLLHVDPVTEAHAARNLSYEALSDVMFMPYEVATPVPMKVDLHIRLASLVPEAVAHTISNNANNPDVFFVLVEKDQEDIDIIESSWDEVYAHVVKPTEPVFPSKAPARII
jgi:hypothetical protein